MSVSRVSFGNVVDIKYRYKEQSSVHKVDKRAYNDRRDIAFELNCQDKNLSEARNMLISEKFSSPANGTIIYRKFNRVITGDDCFTYNILHSVNKEAANRFADAKAQTIIIDV